MKTCRILLLAGVIAFAPLLMVSCGSNGKVEQVERVTSVKAIVIVPSDKEITRIFTGSLEGEQQAVLYAKLGEAVEKVHVKEGQSVKTDQVLISLDKYGPTTRYNEALSVFKNAEKNYQKMEVLFKQGAVAETQFDGAKTQYEVAKANLDAINRMIDIQSPIDGVVTSVKVSAGDQVMVGQQLATVATVNQLRIKFNVNPDDIQYLKKGSEISVSSEIMPQTTTGEVTSVAESADPSTRAFQIEAAVSNRAGDFKPGMFVKIHVVTDKLASVIAVPRDAVMNLANDYVVFVVTNGIAHKRPVELGPELEGQIVIKSGLTPGDTLVTLGQSYLDEGYKVTLASASEGAR